MGKIFFNSEIFPSGGDYIIGGFHTDKESDFSFLDFETAYEDRIRKMVTSFVENTTLLYAEDGVEDPRAQALEDAAKIIADNLDTEIDFFTVDTLVSAIKYSEQSQKWLFELEYRVKNYTFSSVGIDSSISNKINSESDEETKKEIDEAENLTEESNFESFIEQLSMIEL